MTAVCGVDGRVLLRSRVLTTTWSPSVRGPPPRPMREPYSVVARMRTIAFPALPGERPLDEVDDAGDDLVAVDLVEHLVLGALVDGLLEHAAAYALDGGPCVGERSEEVLLAVDPQRRQVA